MFAKITLVFLSIFLVACNDKDDSSQQDCSMTPCTQNFVTITVSVKDVSGKAIVLDSYEVIDTQTGENLATDFNGEEYQYSKEQGVYPILSDANRLEYQNKTTTLTFKGYISNEEVVTEAYEVGADCCHVSLINGNTEIVLE
ncbi:hypothetical protein [Maribacter hydrothermalis]|uniref:Lipoprotein n=1 Tax=Maribacter hydrothermalis TaxID=1836467 RepID=A0A1B7Z436_9FLAO|nr:hypothetical protein [Maribacter hydrothermalis]APQ17222.1 hypothetical protein BTR34_07715 [Maribacter hydrothermalis]OBR37481.1 hypothetical protein A9200_07465 [Maribacter hydrothermalis]